MAPINITFATNLITFIMIPFKINVSLKIV